MEEKDIIWDNGTSFSDNGKAGAAAKDSSQFRSMVTRSQAVNTVKPLSPESKETQDKINEIQQLLLFREVPSILNKVAEKRKPTGLRKARPQKLLLSPTPYEASSSVNPTYSKARSKILQSRLSPDVTFGICASSQEKNLTNDTFSDEMEDELNTSNKSLMEPTSGGKQSPENNNNSVTQSQDHQIIVKYLECHVCRKFSISPIKSCINSHITCGPCMDSMEIVECTICKSGQFFPCLIGEKMAEDAAVKVKCRHMDSGCEQIMLSTKATDHLKECYFRDVECHEYSKLKCRGEKIPLLEIPKHFKEKHAIPTSENSKIVLNLLHGEIVCDSVWPCDLIHFDEKYFVSHAVAAEQKFYVWLTILGNPEQAEKYQSKVILEEPPAPNHLVPKRIKLQKFEFKIPVFPHHDIPRLASCKGIQLTELISANTLQKWSVPRDEIPDQRSPVKYSFKVCIKVTKADEDD